MAVIGFKDGKAGPKELALGDDDDVEAWRDVIMTENLSYQSFSAISLNSAADLLCRRDAKPAHRRLVGLHEQRAIPAMDPRASLVNLLELRMTPDPLVRTK
jgi:hypothetical protein